MSTLFDALNGNTVNTENGAKAFASTLDSVLDFFYQAPASRGKDMKGLLSSALNEDTDLTMRALQWLRDARGGAGEREQYRTLVTYLAAFNTELAEQLISRTPELGRFDDLQAFFGTPLEGKAVEVWLKAMKDGNALAFKWAPRKDKKGAKPLRDAAAMNEAMWRKFMVANSDTVEQKLCAGMFDSINFEHVPSVAMSRYHKAFNKNAEDLFAKYKDALVKGTAKIHAGAVFPHDVVKSCNRGDAQVASAQWAALPDYFADAIYKNVLPVVDVSASMNQSVSGETTAMDVAIALGIYCSERSQGIFKDQFITFSERPSLQTLSGKLHERVNQLKRSDWGYSTDLEKVFRLILDTGINSKVPQAEMPEVVLIPSDMQFNQCTDGTHFMPMLEKAYRAAGYELPKLVFWNMAAREGATPVTKDQGDVALISGFSPSIMQSVLSGVIDPIEVMKRTLNVDRYKL